MKPSFALDFRDGLIALLHRTSRGWQQVGASPLDAPDLSEALSYLRSTALGLSPRGISTKLVLPNDQILYTRVHAPGPDAARRKRQIKAALEGLTPYPVDDLAYDWWGTGPEIHVAVIAKETLAEAEAFAAEHRFNPVSFVAAPDDGSFTGEPFFGQTALAATLLADGEKVERDQDPVSSTAREFQRHDTAPEPEPMAQAAPLAEAAPMAEAAKPDLPPAAPAFAAPETAAAPMQHDKAAPVTNTAEAAAPADLAGLPDFSQVVAPAAGSPPFDPFAVEAALVEEAPMALDVIDPDTFPRREARTEPARPTPPPFPVAIESVAPTTARVANQSPVDADIPMAPAAEIIAAFASRRSPAVPATAMPTSNTKPSPFGQNNAPSVGAAPSQRPSVTRPALARPPAPSTARDTVPFPVKTQTAKSAPPAKGGKGTGGSVTEPGIVGVKRERNVVNLPNSATAASIAGQPAATAARMAAKPSLTKGTTGLDGRPLPPKGKPRYLGLILTVILLLALAAVAFWSSYIKTSGNGDLVAPPASQATAALAPATTAVPPAPVAPATPAPETNTVADTATTPPPATETASAAVPDATAATDTTTMTMSAPTDVASGDQTATQVPTTADEALADGQDPSVADTATDPAQTPVADAVAGQDTASFTADTALPDATPAPVAPVVVATLTATPVAVAPAKLDPAPATNLATESVASGAPANDPQDEIFLAAADTPPQTSDPVSLPQIASSGDPEPTAAPPPPPFGTVYEFDAEGRIKPTAKGIMTPEGVLLIAGRPKVVPPERPAALVAAAAPIIAAAPVIATDAAVVPALPSSSTAGVTDTPTTTPAVTETAAVYADPRLAGKRPKNRPATVSAPVTATDKQGEDLAPAPNSRFAAFRPQLRPVALTRVAAAAPAPNDAKAASLAANGVQDNVVASSVASTQRPAARPSTMNTAVNAAVAAALNAPTPVAKPVPVIKVVAKPASQDPQTPAAKPVAPEAQAEPEVATAMPNLPTNPSVAKQATMVDALNLSRVSLIGVFGNATQRYAMVRQPGGSVRKVVVGDNLDGGRVAAITANAVQYQKGNRMLTLTLPTG